MDKKMQNNVSVTLTGNLTTDPELNYTKETGQSVANFSVASTPRYFDKNSKEWVDAETIFTRCTIWNTPAENAAETYSKGDRVIVTGNMVAHAWEDKEGNARTNYELLVTDMGPSTFFATAIVTRNTKKEEEEEPEEKPVAKKKPTAKSRKR